VWPSPPPSPVEDRDGTTDCVGTDDAPSVGGGAAVAGPPVVVVGATEVLVTAGEGAGAPVARLGTGWLGAGSDAAPAACRAGCTGARPLIAEGGAELNPIRCPASRLTDHVSAAVSTMPSSAAAVQAAPSRVGFIRSPS
jgi:hypothetical protein